MEKADRYHKIILSVFLGKRSITYNNNGSPNIVTCLL